MLRQAGAVVMVGTTMAWPRRAAIARRTSSGFITMSGPPQLVASPTSTAAGPRRARLRR